MDENKWLADRFEAERPHLRGVAYRMLGSLSEADDAVQEAWLNLTRSGTSGVENLSGWLTTVVARVCLDMLRSRKARREEAIGDHAPEPSEPEHAPVDPEREAILADSVGLALLVVLEALAPAERVAFVLHDLFAVPFEEIASIVGRSPDAARQLASRARRRVQGSSAVPEADLSAQREVVSAFLTALRAADFEGLIAVLDPEVVVRADASSSPSRKASELIGAERWAKQAITFPRPARAARPALINGVVGVVIAPRGKLFRVLRFSFAGGKIASISVVGDPAELASLEVGVIEG